MSQSVKLSDGSYIDAGAVWDNTQGSDIESLIATLKGTSFTDLGNLNTQNGNVYALANTQKRCFFYVNSSTAGHTITNWIGKTDGFVIRIGNLMLAVDGWNYKLYYNLLWTSDWHGWTLIS